RTCALPILVGAGFLWRTAAREAASFIPFAAGTIPKVGIAFVGTMTVGKAADYYYRFGKKPSKSQLDQFKEQASALLERLPFMKNEEKKDEQQTTVEAVSVSPNGSHDTEKIGQIEAETEKL